MEKIEKFLGKVLVLFLVFLIVTTFFAIPAPIPKMACSDDMGRIVYTNKITGRIVEYRGGSTCAPTMLGFFWEAESVGILLPPSPTSE